jgi:hypothetical protein
MECKLRRRASSPVHGPVQSRFLEENQARWIAPRVNAIRHHAFCRVSDLVPQMSRHSQGLSFYDLTKMCNAWPPCVIHPVGVMVVTPQA